MQPAVPHCTDCGHRKLRLKVGLSMDPKRRRTAHSTRLGTHRVAQRDDGQQQRLLVGGVQRGQQRRRRPSKAARLTRRLVPQPPPQLRLYGIEEFRDSGSVRSRLSSNVLTPGVRVLPVLLLLSPVLLPKLLPVVCEVAGMAELKKHDIRYGHLRL